MSIQLECYNLAKTYETKRGPFSVFRNLNLKVRTGEFVSIIGHSGCGKSTVLSMVAGLNEISEGAIMLAGKEIDGPGPDRGVVFQSPCLLPWISALNNVLLGVDQVFSHATKAQRRQIALHYLSQVGLADAASKKPTELSQGMRQRVGIARAFALEPKMLLLDEPFGMLDALTRIELQDVLLKLWAQKQITAMLITHDVDEAIFVSDRIICMTDGPEAEIGEVVTVPFERPRDRKTVLADPRFRELRQHIIHFLNERSHMRRSLPEAAARTPSSAAA
ncbi:MAG: ABC transporter ATP-binding protein [Verrucomicrobiaceae bacterium]|nr:ABC transporter ATP-binding protein [Verrucomicrobiaceae bacterium]